MRCPAVTPGYLNLPAKTAEAITADGFYRTGDVMRRDGDGFYYFVGRQDDMFVCGGENIYPGEVELMLERHPAIAQACVVPVPDDIKGMKPLAAVVARPGASVTEDEVRQFALANAPAYMHPRRVFVVPELPLASTNKIDRKAVLAIIQQALAEPVAAGE
jgi:acyl-CoA synthetase (AMP-forming)/AMP-acid ligase II